VPRRLGGAQCLGLAGPELYPGFLSGAGEVAVAQLRAADGAGAKVP
jgi:hypothetical protein